MRYRSTRGQSPETDAFHALLNGIAPDGGLYLPISLPAFSKYQLEDMLSLSYSDLAYSVLAPFFPLPEKDFKSILHTVYNPGRFLSANPAPLEQKKANTWLLRLDQGPTLAFKDMALQLLPHLLTYALQATHEKHKLLILAATSGDTGKAALEGFKDVPSTRVAVVYPRDGVSPAQKLQMMTQTGENVWVSGIEGNFDDAQTQVKLAMHDTAFLAAAEKRGWLLSSANSINIGRLFPQVVYYFHAYLSLVRQNAITLGDLVDFSVPTGNFGDILAGWYAKEMGLPVGKLTCASNKNNVLTDFFKTGYYDIRRTFHTTSSPSMDILISSNLERLLYLLSGDAEQTAKWMQSLSRERHYDASALCPTLQASFSAGYAEEAEVLRAIRDSWRENRCLLDPHTAVACAVDRAIGSNTPTVILSTASPFKFSTTVLQALGETVPSEDTDAAKTLSACTGIPCPPPIMALEGLPLRHKRIIAPEKLQNELLQWLEVHV